MLHYLVSLHRVLVGAMHAWCLLKPAAPSGLLSVTAIAIYNDAVASLSGTNTLVMPYICHAGRPRGFAFVTMSGRFSKCKMP